MEQLEPRTLLSVAPPGVQASAFARFQDLIDGPYNVSDAATASADAVAIFTPSSWQFFPDQVAKASARADIPGAVRAMSMAGFSGGSHQATLSDIIATSDALQRTTWTVTGIPVGTQVPIDVTVNVNGMLETLNYGGAPRAGSDKLTAEVLASMTLTSDSDTETAEATAVIGYNVPPPTNPPVANPIVLTTGPWQFTPLFRDFVTERWGVSFTGTLAGVFTVEAGEVFAVEALLHTRAFAWAPAEIGATADFYSGAGGLSFSLSAQGATIVPATPADFDLEVDLADALDPTFPGDDLAYNITVTNRGPDAANNVRVTHTLPQGVPFVSATGGVQPVNDDLTFVVGTLLSGQSRLLTAVVRPTTPSTFTSSVSVVATGTETDPADNTDSLETTVALPVADLSITLDDGPDPVRQGDLMTYTLTVTNGGPDPVRDVSVQQVLPPLAAFLFDSATGGATPTGNLLSFNLGRLAANETRTLLVAGRPSTAGALSSSASVSAPVVIDTDQRFNSAAEQTQVNQATADLQLLVIDGPFEVHTGQLQLYNLRIYNAGPDLATGVVTFALPTGWGARVETIGLNRHLAGGPDLFNLPVQSTVSGDVVTCVIADMEVSSVSSLYIRIGPLGAGAEGNFEVRADVRALQTDPDPTNDTATETIRVRRPPGPDLRFFIANHFYDIDDGTMYYRIAVNNIGDADALFNRLEIDLFRRRLNDEFVPLPPDALNVRSVEVFGTTSNLVFDSSGVSGLLGMIPHNGTAVVEIWIDALVSLDLGIVASAEVLFPQVDIDPANNSISRHDPLFTDLAWDLLSFVEDPATGDLSFAVEAYNKGPLATLETTLRGGLDLFVPGAIELVSTSLSPASAGTCAVDGFMPVGVECDLGRLEPTHFHQGRPVSSVILTYVVRSTISLTNRFVHFGLDARHINELDFQNDSYGVRLLRDLVSGNYVSFATTNSAHDPNLNNDNLRTFQAVPHPSPADVPPNVNFPLGFFAYELSVPPGGFATVTMFLPPGITLNTYWKYGPTNDVVNPDGSHPPHWYEFIFNPLSSIDTGAEVWHPDRVILHFTDSFRGDDDLIANGLIVEPGGPAFRPNPAATADAYEADEDQTLAIPGPGVLGNDVSLIGDPLSAVLVSGTAHGTLSLQPDGSFTYTSEPNFYGEDSFTYKASDGRLESDAAVVTITVNSVNDAPVASAAGPPGGLRGQALSFVLGALDIEPEDQAAGFSYHIDWNGDGTVDQVVLGPNGTQVDHVFTQAGDFTVRISAADQHGAASDPVIYSLVISDPPPAVQSVVINEGHVQRSMINSITVTFDSRVTIDPGAFELWQQGANKPLKLDLALSEQDGHTLARLTFKSHHVVGSSLPNGHYRLVIRGDKIHDAASRLLDGDGDGQAGGDRVDEFFRRFGDTDGDDDVDREDWEVFGTTFGKRSHQSGYLWYLDYNANGRIWAEDLALFLLGYIRSSLRH